MKFKIGDKVIPIKKTAGICSLNGSIEVEKMKEKNQKYLYITNYDSEYNRYYCHHAFIDDTGDFFNESDLKPYKPILKKFIEEMEKKNEI